MRSGAHEALYTIPEKPRLSFSIPNISCFLTSQEAQKLNKIAPPTGPSIFATFGPAVKDILVAYPDAAPTIEITQQTYQKEVLDSKLPIILDAYSPLCGPCKIMAPPLHQPKPQIQR